MTNMANVAATWRHVDEADDAPQLHLLNVEERVLTGQQGVAGELALNTLPWRLQRPKQSDEVVPQSCEVVLDLSEQPLRCKMLRVQLTTSARHVELYVIGVRRNMLGEDETGEVYFGTFRGKKPMAAQISPEPQYFSVAEEFQQQNRDHDVLKCVQKLRMKFVSLTGDKTVLELKDLKCLYVASAPQRPSGVSTSVSPAANASADSMHTSSPVDILGMMSVGGTMNPQMLMASMHQMLQREVEAKIAQALDAKLSVLSQRLEFSEQMLLQVQQKNATKDAQIEQKLSSLQLQVANIRSQLPTQSQTDLDDKSDDQSTQNTE